MVVVCVLVGKLVILLVDEFIGNFDLCNGEVVMVLFDELYCGGVIICMVIYDVCYVELV